MLKPLFKYPGGKSSEYNYLKELFPKFDTYIEPFVGGGAIYWATKASSFIINDYSKECVSIYKYCKAQDSLFIDYVTDISTFWDNKDNLANEIKELLLNGGSYAKYDDALTYGLKKLPIYQALLLKYINNSINLKRKQLAKLGITTKISNYDDNALGALGNSIYMYLRYLYNLTSFGNNPQLKTALYLFLREYAYSSMFRFNNKGEFNVPFGGNTYAKKDFKHRLNQLTDDKVINKLDKTIILQGDFSKAFVDKDNTFMFLDPPYDTKFSTYNLHNFDSNEQVRLRDELLKLSKTKWLLDIKSTDFIKELYNAKGLYIKTFNKHYSVNFKNRNNKDTSHLIITNYKK